MDSASPTAVPDDPLSATPQLAILDFFFPGFSVFSGFIQKYLHMDLNVYIPLLALLGGVICLWQYFSEYFWGVVESHLMSTVDIRTDDELYNYIMSWVASQRFSQGARRFIANTNLNSRSWFLFRWDSDEDQEEDGSGKKRKPLAYTPTFGSHYFWYKGRVLIFRRNQNRDTGSYVIASEREEISVCCFGRDPWVLKELLHEARETYMKQDESKTLIYRGTTKGGSTEPSWQRCMARTTRPFSTVILNEKVKNDLIADVTDYLNPATRRWYSNRGIPYRRGYLLYGPPGTGKSSLSLALAGFFRMRIYIVSLSSVTASEENLASLFAELPRRCVVLLEDIDTAGLTHTRDNSSSSDGDSAASGADNMVAGQKTPGVSNSTASTQPKAPLGHLSLSGLLNILDGVASQEGRVLIMTTNHMEKLDKALIRPGRVDMIVKFDRADEEMTAAIFRAIFAPLEGDDAEEADEVSVVGQAASTKPSGLLDPKAEKAQAAKRDKTMARVDRLAAAFAAEIPAQEFSPAEIQGFLLKHKRDPEAAVAGANAWVADARKENQEKEVKKAEAKKKEDEEAAKKKKEEQEEEEKKKKEEEKEEKEAKQKAKKDKKKKKKRKSHRSRHSSKKDEPSSESSSSSSSSGSSDSESDSEVEEKKEKKSSKESSTTKKSDAIPAPIKVTATTAEGDATENKPEDVKAVIVNSPTTSLMEEGKHGGDSGYGTP